MVEFAWDCPEVTFSSIISALGEIPIPPYLNRATEQSDSEDYQTVYSHIDGSVAAPTAGLHFTPRVLDEISSRGIPRRELTLHVVGTTSVRTLESLYHLGCMAAQGLDPTVLPQWYPYSPEHPSLSVAESMQALLRHFEGPVFVASTRLMIAPGYTYRIVRGMVTNFHQPRSTLLLLVSAFIGDRPGWRELYDHALAGDYRFLSYGDACLLL